MKKFFVALLVVLLLFMVGCQREMAKVDTLEEKVVITITGDIDEDISLFDYMLQMQENEEIEFTYSNGQYGAYILSINNITAKPNEFWALYTDDEEFSSTEWGQVEYKEKIYASSSLGCETLNVKNGNTYIWVLTKV